MQRLKIDLTQSGNIKAVVEGVPMYNSFEEIDSKRKKNLHIATHPKGYFKKMKAEIKQANEKNK